MTPHGKKSWASVCFHASDGSRNMHCTGSRWTGGACPTEGYWWPCSCCTPCCPAAPLAVPTAANVCEQASPHLNCFSPQNCSLLLAGSPQLSSPPFQSCPPLLNCSPLLVPPCLRFVHACNWHAQLACAVGPVHCGGTVRGAASCLLPLLARPFVPSHQDKSNRC